MQLVARKEFQFDGRRLKPGDMFSANKKHARVLCALRKAESATPERAPALNAGGYMRRDMVAEPVAMKPKRAHTPRAPKATA